MTVTANRHSLRDHYYQIREQMAECATGSGRNAEDVKLIAVSKTRTLDDVAAVAALGQLAFGENTIQDALTKIPFMTDVNTRSDHDPEWHFIGHLQTKKAGKIPGNFQWLHTVDNLKLAEKLSAAMIRHGQPVPLNCLLQVNVSAETAKSGVSEDELKSFIDQLFELELPALRWRGLMTMGVRDDDDATRRVFSSLRALGEEIRVYTGRDDFDQLSMGMSNDFCIAIEEGATMVRVGSSIFGPRER